MDLRVTDQHLALARIVWDYHQLRHVPIPADVILALGTNDLRVARFAAGLFRDGFGQMLLCTGGMAHMGDLLQTDWERSEAEMYADAAAGCGVPRERILLECRATNTAENIRFSRAVLASHGIAPKNIILAVKPFMQRRTWATLAVEWPEMPGTVASPAMTLDEYFTDELAPDKIIHIMMGDLQRIWVYAGRGWSAPQKFPSEVKEAYEALKAAGFTHHLLPER